MKEWSVAALTDEAGGMRDDLVAVRRELHRHPEVGLQLPRTQAVVVEALAGLGLQVHRGEATTSVVAVLEGGRPGPTTLLRSDMDALPVAEQTGLAYASEVDGAMHACGHDAHVAMLVGAARLLAGRREELAGRVLFMFQPGEEGYGGAKVMLAEGLLDRHGPVDRAFAVHLSPVSPAGWVASRAGALMASSDQFRVTVTGKGAHASTPHEGVDPVPVACEMVVALQAMVTRRVAAVDPAVVTVSWIDAGRTFNVTPEAVVLGGTVRALSEAARSAAWAGLRRVVEGVAAAHLCTASVEEVGVSYPMTVNDAGAVDEALGLAAAVVGPDRVLRLPTAAMTAEDWSFVLQRVPGSMVYLGAAPAGVDDPAPNHSPRMVIDEEVMGTGVALHALTALRAPAEQAV
ncbi:MAG TPA: M20 family metallopeptidase [Acidimicrobiales bacterium]|nr:M20 family metallopeptidase [Acidimicrobiales bacterium]